MRCLIVVDSHPQLEARPIRGEDRSLAKQGLCHRTIGFSVNGDKDDDRALAAHLREVAAMLEAPNLPPDPNL